MRRQKNVRYLVHDTSITSDVGEHLGTENPIGPADECDRGDDKTAHLTGPSAVAPEQVTPLELKVPLSKRSSEKSVTKMGYKLYKCFNKKTCKYYCEDKKKEGKRICCCGRLEKDHSPEAMANSKLNVKWNVNEHTTSCDTNAYGEIEFHGTNRKTRAKYIRVANDSNADDALNLLRKEWKLEDPRLLISVTGGAKTFNLPVKLKKQFRDGLLKVAQTTGAWVVTGGTNTGVMKHVGEALQNVSKSQNCFMHGDAYKRVYCIGIATWGIVEHRNSLIENQDSVVKYYMTNSIQSEGACLDNNHTHFFLVDDGTVTKYGAEIKFRAQLEKQIMRLNVDRNRGGVPAVLLVLEGGPNTIQTVYEAISQDPAIPVVVIKDSGRAADLLAFAHTISQGEGPLYHMGDVVEHKHLLKRIEQTYPHLDQSGCLQVYSSILKCVEKKNLITIFKMEGGHSDIDQAILKALLKSNSTSPEDQLNLAMMWNRADIARTEIFKEDLKWPLSTLEAVMEVALQRNSTEFVELLLDRGVIMSNFLTVNRLEDLYNLRCLKGRSIVKYLLGGHKCYNGLICLKDVEAMFMRLTGLSLSQRTAEGKVVNALMPMVPTNPAQQLFSQPFNELFIWAVLNNMQKMAICFWSRGEEAMAKALIACRLYFAMANYADKRDLKDDMIESLNYNAREFQKIATRLLDQCFLSNEPLSMKLLTYELKNWGNSTCLTLAVSSGHEVFVAHSCCQELLSDMWAGTMSFRTRQSLKTIICMFVPPLILKLRFRSKKEKRYMPKTEEEHDEYERQDMEERERESREISELEEKGVQKFPDRSISLSESNNFLYDEKKKNNIAVNFSHPTRDDSLKWWEKAIEFYTAPITKFWGNVTSYLVFLMIYAYVVLGKMTTKISRVEIVLIVYVATLTTEEMRQFLQSDATRFRKKLLEWSQSKWNICDGLAILLFYVGLFLRLNPSTVSAGHVVYSIDIMLWVIRLLDIFSVNQQLGPYVVMIGRMTVDLAYFLFIMAVFLVAYGIARHAILSPKDSTTWKSVAEVFFIPYFQTYGELFIEKANLYSSKTTIFSTNKHDDYSQPIVSILMASYLLIANILLLNLLIAIFNNTYAEVQANSKKIWKFQRYHLIMEYSRRPVLVPPFVFINHVVAFCKYLHRKCKGSQCCSKDNNESVRRPDRKMKFFPNASELSELMQFEEECLCDYLRRDFIHLAPAEEKMRSVLERLDSVGWQIEESKKENAKQLQSKVVQLEDRLETVASSMLRTVSDMMNRNEQQDVMHTRKSNAFNPTDQALLRRFSDNTTARRVSPARFLSHNPFMHSPVYGDNRFVKEAAWNFRKSSLSTGGPSEKEMKDAIEAERAGTLWSEGIDSVDAPPPQYHESTSPVQESPAESEAESSETLIRDSVDAIPSEDQVTDIDHDEPLPRTMSVHRRARESPYPMSEIKRFPVPDGFVDWNIQFSEYEPPEYNSPMLFQGTWVDPESTKDLQFNCVDNGLDRVSGFHKYHVIDGRPRNPFGRTGLTGRGLLGRWGPNHVIEAIVTRWKRSPNMERFKRSGNLYCLEFLASERNDELDIPAGMLNAGQSLPDIIIRAFNLEYSSRKPQEQVAIEEFFQLAYEVSISYDDSRNTDNAWIEKRVKNYHDDDGNLTKNLNLISSNLAWKELDSETLSQCRKKDQLIKVAQIRNANFAD